MALNFLHPLPKVSTFEFSSPRVNHRSASGISVGAFRGSGYWMGSVEFAPSRGNNNNPLPAAAAADRPNAAFAIDLVQGEQQLTTAPTWLPTGDNTNSRQLHLAANHGVRAGDLVSFRQSAYPDFVTARRILALTSDGRGGDIASFTTKLPEEFFPISARSALEYCRDRPHVRAYFTSSPDGWRKDDPTLMRPVPMEWAEDTYGNLASLRSISGIDDGGENVLLTQSGQTLTTESGESLLI